jgi:hypothetical protein
MLLSLLRIIMSLSQENTPPEITFQYMEKEVKLVRGVDGFVNITEIRRSNQSKNFKNIKRDQKEFLEKIEKEIGGPPIMSGDKRSTWIHEKIFERVLRWYDVDEKVIENFVHPDTRVIESRKYRDANILVHLETNYVNASKLCYIFDKQISRWNELESTKKSANAYCEIKLELVDIEKPIKHVIKKGLGYDIDDVWIPQMMLSNLASWCSPVKETNGYVYCLSHPLYDGVYKIGMTTKCPKERAGELSATGHYIDFVVEFAKLVDDCRCIEKTLHNLLSKYRVRSGREFFKLPLNKIKTVFDLVDGEDF